MNLQRYVSTVYSELIPQKYYTTLDPDLKDIDNNVTYESIKKLYTLENKTYGQEKSIQRYLLHTLFFEILFGNTLESLYRRSVNTVFLFPVFFDLDDSSRRFTDLISNIYERVLAHKGQQEFTREPTTKRGDKEAPQDGNMVLFVPVFADGEEESKEFTERITAYFERAFTFINDIRQKKASDTYGNAPDKFENIVYTIDKENRFFTGYYKKKLPEEKSKVLNGIIEKFVEKLGCRISSVKDPMLKVTRDEIRKKIVSDGKDINDKEKETMYQIADLFNDIYKKTNDREYLKLASSSENQTKFRIYYRVNNTDIVDSFSEIKPGSSYVYKLRDPTDKKMPCRVGYFKDRRGSTNQFIFREYKGLTSVACENKPTTDEEKNEVKKKFEDAEEQEFKDETVGDTDEYIIETRNYGNIIKYKRVVQGNYKPIYPGIVEPFMDLHIYEKYKWFQFNELDGTLSPDTNIKIYKNILFDKKSLIAFLKEKKNYTDKTRLAVEFLKINQSNPLLTEYVDYILTNKKSTNVFEETVFSGTLKNFVEKNKKSILDILFQSNELIYMNPQRISQTKENVKQNYKIIEYNHYPIFFPSDVENHFDKYIYEDKEKKYCKKNTCELTKELVQKSEKSNIEYTIAIIDVTKDNVEVVSDLKSKAKCKKLRRTLRKQLQPFLQVLMPRFGGKSKKKLRTRRRKNRH